MDVTVGKYVPGNSIIHKLDPRLKLFGNVLFIVLVFLTKSFIVEAIIFAPVLFAFLLSGLKKRQIFKND